MSKPNFSLEGKVAIVTGARMGIGKELALTFAEAGADVAVCDVESDGLEAVAEEIQGFGRHSLVVQVDISRKTDVDNMVQKVIDEFGAIDILVNNAATRGKGLMLEISEDDWDRIIDIDLKGYFLCSQAVGKRMAERREGNIINMASVMGVMFGEYGRSELPGLGVYAIAKAGVIMLTRVLAQELGSYNIRVNAIAPCTVKTKRTEWIYSKPEVLEKFNAKVPLGRIGQPGDITAAALFLASDASSYITGDILALDGGMLA